MTNGTGLWMEVEMECRAVKSTGQARRRNRRRRQKALGLVRRGAQGLAAAAQSLRQIQFVYYEVWL